jgi:hypothetical protein
VFTLSLGAVSLEQLESAILALTPEERQRLAVWFEENRRELVGDKSDELTGDQEADVIRRRDLALAHPELLEPWDGTIERVRERLHELRRQSFRSLSKTRSTPQSGMRNAGGDWARSF